MTTIKTTVTSVSTMQVEVEVPTACPSCNADLTQPGALRESGYVATEWEAQVGDGEIEYPVEGGYEDFADACLVTGYVCAGCRHVFVDEEEDRT